MVDDGGGEDARHDRPGFSETGCQQEGEQLGLVAHFGERDDTGRDEKSFHEKNGSLAEGTQLTVQHLRPNFPKLHGQWSRQVLFFTARAMSCVGQDKSVDAGPSRRRKAATPQ
ncbi:unnamed protein product [Brugia timori]|uniref:Uncharacterized protein n=1 Tax=Brugia timori TaxID=42155 RepID=A0A0R3QIV2_9BILA|nr:unnamed protein product [Brugia timori]